MKNNSGLRALSPIVIGLFGMAAYPILMHLKHPVITENDFFHGIWFGVCLGLEIIGIHLLVKNKRGAAG